MFKLKLDFKKLFSWLAGKGESNVYDKIIKISIYLTVLLVPLFFLPLAYDSLEFSKAILFYLLVLVGMVTWLIQIVSQKKYDFVKTPFNFPVLLFGLAVFLAALFSVNRFVSFWGTSNLFNETFLSTFFFICFFFLLVNNLRTIKEAVKVLMVSILSLALIIAFNFCQIFGLDILSRFGWQGLPLFNLLAGSVNTLAVFLSVGAPLLFVLLMLARKGLDRIVLTVLLIVDLALIFIIAKPAGVVSLIFGLFVLLFFISWRVRGLSSRWLIIPVVLIVLAIVSLFLPFNNLLNITLPSDLQLDGSTSWQVTKNTLKNHFLFGVGPQNFYHAFAKYKPVAFNQTSLWNLDFSAPNFQWLKETATLGFLGCLALLFLLLKYFLRSFWLLSRQKGSETTWFISIGVFAAWIVVLVAGFLFSFSFVLTFLFWFFLALGTVIIFQEKNKVRSVSFIDSGWAGFGSSLILIILLVITLGYLYFGGRTLLGEIYFTRAGLLNSTPFVEQPTVETARARIKEVNEILMKGINHNPDQSRYHLALAQSFNQEMRMTRDKEEIQNLVTASLTEVSLAIQYSHGLASYYQVAGSTLEELQQILPQANVALIEIMEEAVALNPNHPVFRLNLARAYIFGGSILMQLITSEEQPDPQVTQKFNQYLQSAEEQIKKTVELKDDWVPALHYLALITEQQGKIDEAIRAMEKILAMEPNRAESNYDLGRLYKDQNRQEEAVRLLETAIQLKPDLFEAYLELIDIYESGESFVKAKETVIQALEIFPENEELLAKQKILGK